MNLKLKHDYFYQDYSLPFVFYKNTLLGSEINCNTLYEFGINKIVVILTQGQGPLYVYKQLKIDYQYSLIWNILYSTFN